MFNACIPTYVAETDAQAHKEAKGHLSWIFNTGLKIPDQLFFPPGYMTTKSFRNFTTQLIKGKVKAQHKLSYEELVKEGYIIVGSPETVKNQLGEYCEQLGAGGVINAGSAYGPMPDWMVMKNMQIFAEEVMPAFREADGKPDYLRQARPAPLTSTEFSALVRGPEEMPRARVDGREGLVDLRYAHVDANA